MNDDRELYDRFVAYLRAVAVGANHAQTAVTICAALGLEPNEQSRRSLRACAHQASRCGVLVCSGQSGYYLATSPQDVQPTTARLRREAGELWKRAQRMDQLAAVTFVIRELPESETDRPALFALLEAEA
jgi:hypothetical protein